MHDISEIVVGILESGRNGCDGNIYHSNQGDMPVSGDEYLIKHRQKIERRTKIITIVSIVCFFGSTLFSIIPAIEQAGRMPQPQSPNVSSATVSDEALLRERVRGYELVLQREPDNQIALEKLSLLRLHFKDNKGAIEILTKLVKLHPDRQDYQVALAQLKKRIDPQSPTKPN
jgi:hypothetical protein